MTTENTPEKYKRWCKGVCFTSLLVGLIGAGLTWFLFPVKYEAKAWFFAYSRYVVDVFGPGPRDDYETLLATQFAIITSDRLLVEALQDARMAAIKELRKQKDPVRWLQRNVQVKRQGKSEFFTISYRDMHPETAKAVVDVVSEAYFARYENDFGNR